MAGSRASQPAVDCDNTGDLLRKAGQGQAEAREPRWHWAETVLTCSLLLTLKRTKTSVPKGHVVTSGTRAGEKVPGGDLSAGLERAGMWPSGRTCRVKD